MADSVAVVVRSSLFNLLVRILFLYFLSMLSNTISYLRSSLLQLAAIISALSLLTSEFWCKL